MSGRHTITIELNDDEYRHLEDLARHSERDVRDCAHQLVRERLKPEALDNQHCDAPGSWEDVLDAFARLRKTIPQWAPGEFREFLSELRHERDARP